MTSLDVARIISEDVQTNLVLPFTFVSDIFLNDGEGACIRHDPSQASEKRFTDGSRLCSWNLAIYVRNKKNNLARDYTKEISDYLDGKRLEGFVDKDETISYSIDVEAVTLPQFISRDDKGQAVYTSVVRARFTEE